MPYELINRMKAPSTLTVIDGNVTLNLSQLSANTNTENVISAIITSMKWSSPQGAVIKVVRDAGGGPNTVANLSYGDFWSHDDLIMANTPRGNIAVTITGGGTIIMTIRKEAAYNVQTQDL
jgi:hypothetical protein